MKTLLKIQTSLFKDLGQSSVLVNQFAESWLARHPEGQVLTRDLAANPVPHLDLARFQAFTAKPEDRTTKQQQVVDYSDTLIEELRSADVIVLGVPMYNFDVPSVLRAYFDHIARAGETFRYTNEGPEGLLKGKKAYVFITRGGVYGEGHSQSEYVRQFLGFVGLTDVQIVYAEGLAMSDESKTTSLAAAQERISKLLAA